MKKQILFFYIILVVSSCVPRNSIKPTPLSEFEADTQVRQMVEGNAEIKIPINATGINGHVNGFREIDTELRFIIHPSDLDLFLESTACELPLLKDDVRSIFQDQLTRSWWNPTDAQKYGWCHGEKEHLIQNVLIDMTDLNEYIVYVMAQTK